MAVDPRDFLLNTDYEMDKIIYYTSGSLNSGDYDVSIPHDLGFAPLAFGVCAFNSDFSDPRTIPYNYQAQSDFVFFNVTSTTNDIKLSFNTASGSPSKAYYRIYGFEPTTSTATIPATSDNAGQFVLNTDYNYCKLYQSGIVNGNATTTIAHNLGYIPQVLAWVEDNNGSISPIDSNAWTDPIANIPIGIAVTISGITFKYTGAGLRRIHYRVYYDEN